MTQDELMGKVNDLITQWGQNHPDQELAILSLPKNDPQERHRLLWLAAELLAGDKC
jgi:hypothetical protein